MTRGRFKVFTIIVFLLTAGVIGALVFLPENFFSSKNREIQKTRVVIPQNVGVGAGGESSRAAAAGEDTRALKINLEADEEAVTALTLDFDGDSNEEQVIAYRKFQDIDSPIYIAYIAFDESKEAFYRQWNAPTAASKPGTLILYSEDLIGDGGISVIVSGMNNSGEQTLTAFRKMDSQTEPFVKIAEFLIEGSIAVEDSNYGRRAPGYSLSIATYGRDYSSTNIMDQIEATYTFNPVNSLYEQSGVVRIPGTRIEQMRVRELLSGDPKRFEGFINGLWYQEAGNEKKYVYFNPASREVIFYNNNSQEVFSWQNSTATPYGLHITGSNVSLTKLRRTVNVELVSLESIRLRVFQDAYLRSGPAIAWDGAYQRLPAVETVNASRKAPPFLEGRFASEDAVIVFNRDGSYRLDPITGPSELSRDGRYALFAMESAELLELRTTKTGNSEAETTGAVPETARETFRISQKEDTLTLSRIRIGTRGIEDLHEAPIVLQKNG